MKFSSTPTHVLSLLLMAATCSSAHQHDLHHHSAVFRGVSHDDLRATVQGEEHDLLHPLEYYSPKFIGWALKHGVWFDSVSEGVHALKNFARADDKIALHDSEETGYTIGHNAYSHMSWEEFRDHFSLGKGMVLPPRGQRSPDFRPRLAGEAPPGPKLGVEDLPEEVDWTKKGGVTEVKNQGSCGSCWSFSTTGSMEGAHFIKTGDLAVLSEQELVDCDTYDMGCQGGLMDYSFHWIQQNGGICSEQDYPYIATGGICQKSSCDVVPGTGVDKWIDVGTTEEELMAAVAQQPVSIAIEADQMSFQLYSGGVLTATCGTNLDHGVLLVGYGVYEDGTKYWKVKNSWGGDWGMKGYILLKREAPQHGGECGILMQASYPVLA
ncbi:unnamed protein product [Sphacelaria rigidula]